MLHKSIMFGEPEPEKRYEMNSKQFERRLVFSKRARDSILRRAVTYVETQGGRFESISSPYNLP